MQTFWFCSLPNYERINFIGYLQSFSTWSTCGILLYQRLLVRIWYLALGVCCLSHSFWGSCNIYFATLVTHWHCDICCSHFMTPVTHWPCGICCSHFVTLVTHWHCDICCSHFKTPVTFTRWHLLQSLWDNCHICHIYIGTLVTFTCDTCHS